MRGVGSVSVHLVLQSGKEIVFVVEIWKFSTTESIVVFPAFLSPAPGRPLTSIGSGKEHFH
jgi:hypothetical protein